MKPDNRIETYLVYAILVFSCFILILAVFQPFSMDEFEHIHSAWYVNNGFTPYKDFFEHHHSLFWYMLVPFLWVFGETITSLIMARLLMYLFAMGMGWAVYSISRELNKKKRVGLLSVFILFTTVLFVHKSIEIRPDVPQVLFGLLAILKSLQFLKLKKTRDLYLSAFFVSISFLFLQKSLFLVAAYLIYLIYLCGKKVLAFRFLIFVGAILLVPVVVFIAFQYSQGALWDYFVTNWLFNLNRGAPVFIYSTIFLSWIENTFFWLFAPYALYFAIRHKKDIPFKFVIWMTVVQIISLLLVLRPWSQYFLFPISLLSVISASVLFQYYDSLIKNKARLYLLVALLLIPPTISYTVRIAISNKKQIKTIRYVLENTSESDFVYDGYSRFNLFRPDLHYYWFDVGFYDKNLKRPKYIQDRLSDFDIPGLIQKFKPKVISDYRLDLFSEPFSEMYKKTRFQKTKYDVNLYVLEEKK